MAPKAKKAAPLDDGLDQFLQKIQPQKFSNDQAAAFFLVGLTLALVPAYLYHSVYDLSFADFGLVYVVITVGVAGLLTLSYRNLEQGTQVNLSASRKNGYYLGSKSNDETEKFIAEESLFWSLFQNNATFIGLFAFLAFYALRQLDPLYSYVAANSVAGIVTWKASSAN